MHTFLCSLLLLLFSMPVVAQSRDTLIRYFNAELDVVRKKEAAYVGLLVRSPDAWEAIVFDTAMQTKMRGAYLDTDAKIRHGYFSYYDQQGKRYLGGRFEQNLRTGLWETWHSTGKPKDSVWFMNDLAEGRCSLHYEDGRPEAFGQYTTGVPSGQWQWFHENGNPATIEAWKQGKLEDLQCFDTLGVSTGMTCAVSRVPVVKGKYGGFEQFVRDSLRFPEEARKNEMEGYVTVTFAVLKSGEVTPPRVLYSSDSLFSKEVLRLLQSVPGWYPAISHNRTVNHSFTYNIPFYLDGERRVEELETLDLNQP